MVPFIYIYIYIQGLTNIGDEITETLEHTAASLVKRCTIIGLKHAQPKGEGIIIGQLPTRPIKKPIAETSLLSHILVSKSNNHRCYLLRE